MKDSYRDPVWDGSNWYVYVHNDPVNFIDPLGLDELVAIYNRDDTLKVHYVGTQGDQLTGDLTTYIYTASNNVRSPDERGEPVFDTTANARIYPGTFPASPEEGWNLLSTGDASRKRPGVSNHPDPMIGPFVETDARRMTMSYEQDSDGKWVATGRMVEESGFYIHGGDFQGTDTGQNNVQSTTLGCMRVDNSTPPNLQDLVDEAIGTGGRASLHVSKENE